MQIQALNDLYRRADGKESQGFGKRTISGGGTWLSVEEDGLEGQAPRRTKKNMAKVQCKACGQVNPCAGHSRDMRQAAVLKGVGS